MIIGGYAVNYYGYNRNTHDLDVWIAPTDENRQAFINTLRCMNYSENEVSPLYKEDFTQLFKADIGANGANIDVLTFVHPSISFDDAEKEPDPISTKNTNWEIVKEKIYNAVKIL